jgi:hypothetical protein
MCPCSPNYAEGVNGDGRLIGRGVREIEALYGVVHYSVVVIYDNVPAKIFSDEPRLL